MAERIKLKVDLEINKAKLEADLNSILGAGIGAGAGGGGKGGGGLGAGIGKAGGVGIALNQGIELLKKIVTVLEQSSSMLKGVLGGIAKILLLILKPIGDMLAVALLPLLYMLKPVARFFNMMMKPYIQKAMAAMKFGGQLLKEGKPEEAAEAFSLGFGFILKPLTDAFLDILAIQLTSLTDKIGEILSLIPGLGWLGDAFLQVGESVRESMNGMEAIMDVVLNQKLAALGQSMIDNSDMTQAEVQKIMDKAGVDLPKSMEDTTKEMKDELDDVSEYISTDGWGIVDAFKSLKDQIWAAVTAEAVEATSGFFTKAGSWLDEKVEDAREALGG